MPGQLLYKAPQHAQLGAPYLPSFSPFLYPHTTLYYSNIVRSYSAWLDPPLSVGSPSAGFHIYVPPLSTTNIVGHANDTILGYKPLFDIPTCLLSSLFSGLS
jgi:hypothetical protein